MSCPIDEMPIVTHQAGLQLSQFFRVRIIPLVEPLNSEVEVNQERRPRGVVVVLVDHEIVD